MGDYSATAGVVGSSFAAAVLGFVGVPAAALFWGFVAAGSAAVFTPPEASVRAIATVIAAGLLGAGAGHALAQALGNPPGALVLACIVIGAGAKVLLVEAVETARQTLINLRAWAAARLGGGGK